MTEGRQTLTDAVAPVNVEVILLRAVGVADGEIAARLGIPVESVPVLVEIGIRKLRRALDIVD